jgi:GT2 family glycosyltransferase/glycosyltransferase involved in cell wall biosynthesis
LTSEQASLKAFIDQAVNASLESSGSQPRNTCAIPGRLGSLDIAIPIYNNAALLKNCLQSLLPTLDEEDHVWLVDDASDDPDVAKQIRKFKREWSNTHVLNNPQNLGFVGSSNRAFAATHRDIVLLNSDTEVTDGWLEQMQACLHRNPDAGIVCPLSDHATILSSVPEMPPESRPALFEVMRSTTAGDTLLPTAVGFCMLIRRQLIDHVGTFSQAFAPGYGEENDFSMRAMKSGWDIVAADQACVIHNSGGSFDETRSRRLKSAHHEILNRIWPEYRLLVQSWWRDNPLRIRTEQLADLGASSETVVHVMHRPFHIGGTERVTRSLIANIGDPFHHLLVYPGATVNQWCDFELRTTGHCRELMLNNRWIRPALRIAEHGADVTCPHSERSLARIIKGSGAKIVHFHHMLHWDSLLLPLIARELGCRVVISVHDFWINCANYNQLEHISGQPCRRSHSQDDERCLACLKAHASTSQDNWKNLDKYHSVRHAVIRKVLESVDVILVPSEFIRQRIVDAYPGTNKESVIVQPHGVNLPAKPASKTSRSRIFAYFGGDQSLKGADLVLMMARSLIEDGIKIRIYGRTKGFDPASIPINVELAGFYQPEHFGSNIQDVDLALLPTFYEESFSMVASECWAHGVPVLASNRGALSERVIEGVNGWLVSDMDTKSWTRKARSILQGNTLEKCRQRLLDEPPTSIVHSAGAVAHLYSNLTRKSNHAAPQQVQNIPPPRFMQKLKALRADQCNMAVDQRCLGILRDHWGTPAYRGRFPLQELERSGISKSSHFHVVKESGFRLASSLQKAAARHILVQPFLSDEGLELMDMLHRDPRYLVTLVVDDLWTGLQNDNPAVALMPEDVEGRIRQVTSLSQSVVLTTPELNLRLNLPHDNKHVINNALPGWIWNSLFNESRPEPRNRLRIGWAGAPQHAGDLKFLEKVVEDTKDLADWIFLGMCPGHIKSMCGEFHRMVPFHDYPAKLASLELDLAIAPLADHAFNRCKSHLKVLEYGILGVPVVASELEPYRHCPVPRAKPDDVEEWTHQLRHLLQNHEERRELGHTLRQWVLTNHMTEHKCSEWAAALGIENDVKTKIP